MLEELQVTFDFDGDTDGGSQISPVRVDDAHLPAGYKGFASFHKYWGKKPIEAWRFLIEKLTEPNSIVLDPFLGSGLIAKECIDQDRRFIGFDVNPISIELTKLYLQAPSYMDLRNAICCIENRLKSLINSMYLLSDGNLVTHILWENDRIRQVWTKRGRKRIALNVTKDEIERLQNVKMYEPRLLRELRLFDNSRINSQKTFNFTKLFTPRALRAIDLIKAEIEGDLHSGETDEMSLIFSKVLQFCCALKRDSVAPAKIYYADLKGIGRKDTRPSHVRISDYDMDRTNP